MECSAGMLYVCCGGVGAVGSVLVSFAFVWYSRPEVLIRAYFRMSFWKLGYVVKYVTIGKYTICYAEKGTRQDKSPTLLFVHGFTTSKDSWLPILQRLPSDAHVVVMDLPGHGGSTIPTPQDDVSVDTLTQVIHQLTVAVGLRDFHLVGLSLGGALAENFAVEYSEGVRLLTLICPAMRTPRETVFQRELREGTCILLADRLEDLAEIIKRNTFSKPKLNKNILKGLLNIRLPRNDFFKRLFVEIHKLDSGREGREFEEKVQHIVTPTQIIWGKQDELLDVSGAELLESRLGSSCRRVDLLDRCGHSVCIDRPGAMVSALLAFRKEMLVEGKEQ